MDEEKKVSSVSQYLENGKTESDYWIDVVTGRIITKEAYEKVQEEKDKKEKEENNKAIIYYICTNKDCNYLMQSKEAIPEKYLDDVKEDLVKTRCPKCGKTGFKLITKEEYDKQEKINKTKIKQAKKEELDHNRLLKRVDKAIIFIEREREKLFDDLSSKLKNKDITPQRFISLFYNCNHLILIRAQKNYNIPNFDWNEHRKTIMKMADEVIRIYNIKETEDEILAGYDRNQDEIFKVYEENYVEDNEEAFIEYKQSARLNDYMKSLEEKASKKYVKRQENKVKIKQDRLDNDFGKMLKEYVKKL